MGQLSNLDIKTGTVTFEVAPYTLEFKGTVEVMDESLESVGVEGILSAGSGVVLVVVEGTLEDADQSVKVDLPPGRYVLDADGFRPEIRDDAAATKIH